MQQDVVLRGGQALPLYARVAETGAPLAIVLPAAGGQLQVCGAAWRCVAAACFGSAKIKRTPGAVPAWYPACCMQPINPSLLQMQVDLRPGDVNWQQFLASVPQPAAVRAHVAASDDTANILFSSGTTGKLE